MKRRITCALLSLTMAAGLAMPAYAAEPIATAAVYVNEQSVDFTAGVFSAGTTCLPMRAATLALYPDAQFEGKGGKLTATGEGFVLTAKVGDAYFCVNDRYLYVPSLIQADEDGEPMIPSREFGTAMGAYVGWDGAVVLYSLRAPLQQADRPVSDSDLDLIARVVEHEAGNQPLSGRIGVANVILHRVADKQFPNTVSGVLYQKNQFPGATNAKPDATSILAAKLAADGAETVPGALWFNGIKAKDFKFAKRAYEIGGHAFFVRKK